MSRIEGAADPARADSDLTRRLVEQALGLRRADLPDAVARIAADCLLDWLGCACAGRPEPVSRIVVEAAREEGGHPQATLVGEPAKASVLQAALVNGTLSHALDYDDVNLAVPGHLSAAIWPALLALGEQRGASAGAVLTAFVAGYELACRIGTLVEPAHYANGFHATATIGGLGAAMACAHLLDLPSAQARHAIGLAATQAAGLKAMFGSMAKPLHAGLAAQSGLRSALLAARGLVSRPDSLECEQGFVQVHGGDFHLAAALGEPPRGFHLRANLFKFHAACLSVHSTIDAVAALREAHRLDADAVREIRVVAGHGCSICNIQEPSTGLEAKFSLRASAAFALLGIATDRLDSWDRVGEPAVQDALHRVRVELVPGMGLSDSVVTLVTREGVAHTRAEDCGTPISDGALQTRRLEAKFRAIATPTLGAPGAEAVVATLRDFDGEVDLGRLMGQLRP